MRRPSAVPRAARACLAVLAALVAGAAMTACTSTERAPDSARAGVDSSVATPAPSAASSTAASHNAPATAAAAALPGALTKPIDRYSGDELYDLVKRLRWGGGAERQRKCKGNPACSGARPGLRTLVRVDAVDGQDSISAVNLPADGVIGMRAQNRGKQVENRYGFKPDKKLEYYLIVLPGSATRGRWRLEELDTTPGARRHTSVGSGTFTPCNHPFQRRRINRANFYTCTDSHMGDSVQRSGLRLFDPDADPMWMDCAQGCCVAE